MCEKFIFRGQTFVIDEQLLLCLVGWLLNNIFKTTVWPTLQTNSLRKIQWWEIRSEVVWCMDSLLNNVQIANSLFEKFNRICNTFEIICFFFLSLQSRVFFFFILFSHFISLSFLQWRKKNKYYNIRMRKRNKYLLKLIACICTRIIHKYIQHVHMNVWIIIDKKVSALTRALRSHR